MYLFEIDLQTPFGYFSDACRNTAFASPIINLLVDIKPAGVAAVKVALGAPSVIRDLCKTPRTTSELVINLTPNFRRIVFRGGSNEEPLVFR